MDKPDLRRPDGKRKTEGTGRDEINLIDFPLSVFGKNLQNMDLEEDNKVSVRIYNKLSKKSTMGYVRLHFLRSDDTAALLPGDEDLIMLLAELSAREGFKSDELEVPSLNFLITRLGWTRSGNSFARIIQCFLRLRGLTIETDVFYDKKSKSYGHQVFGILSSVYIAKQGIEDLVHPDTREIAKHVKKSAGVRVIWDRVLWGSFQSGNYKYLNMKVYWAIKTPGARKLYRVLDKKFYAKDEVNIPLTYIGTLLGLELKWGAYAIKNTLNKYIKELVRVEYLSRAEYTPSSQGELISFTKRLLPVDVLTRTTPYYEDINPSS